MEVLSFALFIVTISELVSTIIIRDRTGKYVWQGYFRFYEPGF